MLHDPDSAIRALRWCEHGETVAAGQTSTGCSGCIRGHCGAALACMQPEPTTTRKPITGLAIGAVLAAGGAGYIAGAAARHFFSF